jgi:hypothetical protein
MAITEFELKQAEIRMDTARGAGHAVSARYDRRRSRVVVTLNTGVELAFPTRLAEGLADASPDETCLISKSVRPVWACTGLAWTPTSMFRRCRKACSAQRAGWRASSARKAADRAPSPRSPPHARTDEKGGHPRTVAKA